MTARGRFVVMPRGSRLFRDVGSGVFCGGCNWYLLVRDRRRSEGVRRETRWWRRCYRVWTPA